MSTGIVKKVEPRQRWSLFKGTRYWWVQVGRNGEILSSSEMYTTEQKRDQTAIQVADQLGVPYGSGSAFPLGKE